MTGINAAICYQSHQLGSSPLNVKRGMSASLMQPEGEEEGEGREGTYSDKNIQNYQPPYFL